GRSRPWRRRTNRRPRLAGLAPGFVPDAQYAAMPGLTVEDLLRQVFPSGSEIVAGRIGGDREVTWPTTLRTRPPAFQHVKGGEVALVSIEAMKLLDPRMQLTTVVRSLAGLSVAAVAVLGEVSREARALADSVGLPLLTLPDSAHL